MATAATTRFEFEAQSTRGCVPSPTSKLIKSHQELPTINSHKQLAFVRAVTSRTGGCAAGSSKDLEEPARGSGDPASGCCVRSARCSRQSACAYALGTIQIDFTHQSSFSNSTRISFSIRIYESICISVCTSCDTHPTHTC